MQVPTQAVRTSIGSDGDGKKGTDRKHSVWKVQIKVLLVTIQEGPFGGNPPKPEVPAAVPAQQFAQLELRGTKAVQVPANGTIFHLFAI